MHLAAYVGRTVSVYAVWAWGPLMDTMRKMKTSWNKVRKEQKADFAARCRVIQMQGSNTRKSGGRDGEIHEQNNNNEMPYFNLAHRYTSMLLVERLQS